jgi:Rrf2 family protein
LSAQTFRPVTAISSASVHVEDPGTGAAMISHKAKYALRALVALAQAEGDSLVISEIARRQRIPKKFLEQILLELKHEGIVASRRGKVGGYMLLRRPEQVTYGEILRLVDGPIAPLPCLSRTAYQRCADCSGEESCEVRRVFARVAEASRAVLDRTTLADSLAKAEQAMVLPEPAE